MNTVNKRCCSNNQLIIYMTVAKLLERFMVKKKKTKQSTYLDFIQNVRWTFFFSTLLLMSLISFLFLFSTIVDTFSRFVFNNTNQLNLNLPSFLFSVSSVYLCIFSINRYVPFGKKKYPFSETNKLLSVGQENVRIKHSKRMTKC